MIAFFEKLIYNDFVWRFLLSVYAYFCKFALSNDIWVVSS